MKQHFTMMADYNGWANRWVYSVAATLDDEALRRPIGLFFGSVHATLNHLVLADRIWLGRLTGEDVESGPLDRILHQDFAPLAAAREREDARLKRFVDSLAEADFDTIRVYQNMAGDRFEQPLSEILAHVVNHQTHHRGQIHAGLSILGKAPPSLDLLAMHRGIPTPQWGELGRR